MVDRTPCPRDGDAFSYDPKHLAEWFIQDDLWSQLPESLRQRLAAVQHAGAAVLTGFERLDELSRSMRRSGIDVAEVHIPRWSNLTDTESHDATPAEKPLRTDRIDSFTTEDQPNADALLGANLNSPAMHQAVSEPASRMSPFPSPQFAPLEAAPVIGSPAQLPEDILDTSSTGSCSPAFGMLPPPTSMPSSFTQESILSSRPSRRDDTPSVRSRHPSTDGRHHFRTHSAYSNGTPTPQDPHKNRYLTELSHLRCVAIVRLRHKARGVDIELGEMRRSAGPAGLATEIDEFENLWVRKRQYVARLDMEGAAIESRQLALDANETEAALEGRGMEAVLKKKMAALGLGIGREEGEMSSLMATPA